MTLGRWTALGCVALLAMATGCQTLIPPGPRASAIRYAEAPPASALGSETSDLVVRGQYGEGGVSGQCFGNCPPGHCPSGRCGHCRPGLGWGGHCRPGLGHGGHGHLKGLPGDIQQHLNKLVHHQAPYAHNIPPAQRLLEPGPGVNGPGPGVLLPAPPPGTLMIPPPPVQLLFARPEGMQLRWDVTGSGNFDSQPLVLPARSNFPQGGIYRLKLTSIPGRVGVELYPTVEVGPCTPRSAAFLAHNAIPVQFTDEDLDQVMTGNFVTKVIYLPDPEFQDPALAGVDILVSTRLEPGEDPIVEADRRGSILAIVRLGNKDLEMPGAGGVALMNFQAGDPGPMQGYPMGQVPPGMQAAPPGMMGGPSAPPMSLNHPFLEASGTIAPPYISGLTAPNWGMPITGTPIGLPGPPHIPLGGPAGLQAHSIRNHTHHFLPEPTTALRMHVKQHPGISYPRPADRVFVREHAGVPWPDYHQPGYDKRHVLNPDGGPFAHEPPRMPVHPPNHPGLYMQQQPGGAAQGEIIPPGVPMALPGGPQGEVIPPGVPQQGP